MTKRILLLLGIVFLGTFYLFVISRIFQLNVSERYRAYYIDKQPNVWLSPDATGARLNSPTSIFLPLNSASEPPTHMIIESRSRIMSPTSPIEVTVLMNHQKVGTLLYGLNIPDKPKVLPVPAAVLDKGSKTIEITFVTQDSLWSALARIRSITLVGPGSPGKKKKNGI